MSSADELRVVTTADWHIGQYKGPTKDGQNLRFLDIRNCLEALVNAVDTRWTDLVIVSGDIFNQSEVQAKRVSQEVLLAADIIHRIALSTRVVVLRGTPNHDGKAQFELLEKLLAGDERVTIVTTPTVVRTAYADIACIPGFDKQEFRARYPGLSSEEENQAWTELISDLVKGLRLQCQDGKPAILTAHYTVPGANTESGQSSFFANFEPVIPTEALRAAEYDAVFLGHIHRPQRVEGFTNVFYSGAVNALNFNDEGQQRGFWEHRFEGTRLAASEFLTLPYREFLTLKWTTDDVARYQHDRQTFLSDRVGDAAAGKIVRVKYSCTPEQKKAMNIPLLQSDLYEAGAFYVSEIEAESTTEIANRELLSEESDPLANLKAWLKEKNFKDPEAIAELGEPIIQKAQMLDTRSKVHGVFRPVSIAVKNYRNYVEEHFDFSDISFCTINGQNGAGKSSLFMDAIIDALYEEPREGDLKGWIRATEDARSGSIEFIFDIGSSRFRVVRTRVKSGKATLNLSQLGDDGVTWVNRSKERLADTQAEIEAVIGMDSLTFRSCALIMQDQYGLFLQAKKEDRVSILGNLLGLGIYNLMEKQAREQLGDCKRKLAAAREAIKVKNEMIEAKDHPEEALETINRQLDLYRKAEAELSGKYEDLRKKAEARTKIWQDMKKAVADERQREGEIRAIQEERKDLQSQISQCEMVLSSADEIHQKEAQYRQMQATVRELFPETVRRESEQKALDDVRRQVVELNLKIEVQETSRKAHQARIERLRENSLPPDIEDQLEELAQARERMEEIRIRKDREALEASQAAKLDSQYQMQIQEVAKELEIAQAELDRCQRQKEFLDNSGCPHIETATCRFLERAKKDVSQIEALTEKESELTVKIQKLTNERIACSEEEKKKISEIGYSAEVEQKVSARIRFLSLAEGMKKNHEAEMLEISRLEASVASDDKMLEEYREQGLQLTQEVQRRALAVEDLNESVNRYEEAVKKEKELDEWATKAKSLPVIEERLTNLREKLEGKLSAESEAQEKLTGLRSEIADLTEKLSRIGSGVEEQAHDMELQLQDNRSHQEWLNITKGSLTQKIEDIRKMEDEIGLLQTQVDEQAAIAVRYDALKQAFSQDGVPHQIIRNIVPHITDTANSILGSMTGGTMGVEFVLEKTIRGKDGEKATLDVLIDEYGKTKLPYAAKSGGEKVKSSLAIILALSEIKATAAGIQLGMLFIDEPPFLDDEGTQAYVDALETIRKRYPDVKVMAITHDDAMKARFTQSVTVIKTEEGSKVVY